MKVEIYKAKDGWRWRAKAANGKIVADSGEGYERRIDCVNGIVITSTILMRHLVEFVEYVSCHGTAPIDEVEK